MGAPKKNSKLKASAGGVWAMLEGRQRSTTAATLYCRERLQAQFLHFADCVVSKATAAWILRDKSSRF